MKQPDWKPALILSTTVFVLGSFTYWLQYSHKPKKEKSDELLKKPLSFAAENTQIQSFKIKSAALTIEGKCDSLSKKTCKVGSTGEWSLTAPQALKGDGDSIRDYLNTLSMMNSTETIDLTEETPEKRSKLLEEYGLSDSSRAQAGAESVELTLEDGRRLTAAFGVSHPIGDKCFVGSLTDGKLNSDKIFVVANFYRKNAFEKGLSHFRDKTIFTFDRKDVERFSAKTPKERLEGKRDNGVWQINGKEADGDRIETLLSSIAQAKAKEFPEPATLKGAKPLMHYELYFKGGKNLSFDLLTGKNQNFLKSKDLPIAFEVDDSFKGSIEKTSLQLRNNLLLAETEKVLMTRARFEGKEFATPAEFRYDGKAWTRVQPDSKLDPSKVTELLKQMASAHSPSIVAPAPKVKGPSVTLSLGDEKTPIRRHFQFYEAGGKAFARDLGAKSDEAFEIDSALKNAFPFKPDSWKTK